MGGKFWINSIRLIFLSPNHPSLFTFVILINQCIKKINWSYMHTACHNVYTLTAHVTGFRRVLVTPHALVLAMCTTVGGVASDSITWSVRREIDSWAIWHRVKNRLFNLFCKSNNNFYDCFYGCRKFTSFRIFFDSGQASWDGTTHFACFLLCRRAYYYTSRSCRRIY